MVGAFSAARDYRGSIRPAGNMFLSKNVFEAAAEVMRRGVINGLRRGELIVVEKIHRGVVPAAVHGDIDKISSLCACAAQAYIAERSSRSPPKRPIVRVSGITGDDRQRSQ